jgi:hypothetical protein
MTAQRFLSPTALCGPRRGGDQDEQPSLHQTTLDVYTDRFRKMPTVGSVLRALPGPADHPVFRITTSRAAETPCGFVALCHPNNLGGSATTGRLVRK